MLVIKAYNESYREQWDAYVRQSDGASFFHLTGWMDAVERVFRHRPHYSLAVRDDRICGILPLFEVKSRLFGHSLVSIPYAVYGGIAADDPEADAALRKGAESLACLMQVDYLELRGGGAQEEPWHGKDLYVTFQRPILPTVEENLQAIPRKQRAMVRKGEKSGLTSTIGGLEHLDLFYPIYAQNVRDLGSPVYPKPFFRALMENFPDAFILGVWQGEKMVAGVLTFVHQGALLPYYGGGLREHFEAAVNDFMYWELMKYGCEGGFTLFDFGRSKKGTGSYRFKKHWGFEPTDLDYSCFLVRAKEPPNISPVNPKYSAMINVWKRLPLPVSNWLGPKIVRGIP